MEYRLLGGTDVRVSALCFGTMTFGGDSDEIATDVLFARCRDAGINFFDIADGYTHGRSEEILTLRHQPPQDELVVTTTFASPMRPGHPDAGVEAPDRGRGPGGPPLGYGSRATLPGPAPAMRRLIPCRRPASGRSGR